MSKGKSITVRALVSGNSLEPSVQVNLVADDGTEEEIAEWTVEEAQTHALSVLDAVEQSRTNALLTLWMTRRLKT